MHKQTAQFFKNLLKNTLQTVTLVFFMFTLSTLTSCDNNAENQNNQDAGSKVVEVKIKDIRSKKIVYDIYQVKNDELEYVATEVADRDGSTVVNVEVAKTVNNIIIKRTKDGVEKRQVVPLKTDKVEVQFLL